MSAMLSIVATLALCCAGMAGLSLAMDRHYQQIRGIHKVPQRWRTFSRSGGWVLLAVALTLCVKTWGAGVGVVTWCASLTAGAMAVIWLLPYSPRIVTRLAAIAAGIGVSLALWQFVLPAEASKTSGKSSQFSRKHNFLAREHVRRKHMLILEGCNSKRVVLVTTRCLHVNVML